LPTASFLGLRAWFYRCLTAVARWMLRLYPILAQLGNCYGADLTQASLRVFARRDRPAFCQYTLAAAIHAVVIAVTRRYGGAAAEPLA